MTFVLGMGTQIERECENQVRLLVDHAGFPGSRTLKNGDRVRIWPVTQHTIDVLQKETMAISEVLSVPSL
jgi:hypothetical protein